MVNDASLKEPLPGPVGPEVGTADELDPELLALPAPPAGRRLATMAVMAYALAEWPGPLRPAPAR